MKVLVTGATGFVGKRVVKQLFHGGHEVVVLTRNIPKAALALGSKCQYFVWTNMNELPPIEAFKGVDGVINLMGEGIAEKKWDEAQKKKIYDSRINGTHNLVKTMKGIAHKPSVFVSASAVGIYGNRGDEEITEASTLADDFLAKVCKDWEAEAFKAEDFRTRVAVVRTGVVLGRNGGAMQKMLPIFKMGAGGKLGSGHQYMSWIHVEDLAGMYIEILKHPEATGVFNGTAPNPVTNKEFTKILGNVVKRPTLAPVPPFALKLVYGEMSQVLLEGQKVIPKHFEELGYEYRYTHLEPALKEFLGHEISGNSSYL